MKIKFKNNKFNTQSIEHLIILNNPALMIPMKNGSTKTQNSKTCQGKTTLLLQEIQFQDVKTIWSSQLWPNRKSEIEKISYIDDCGKIDMKIQNWAQPRFFAIIENNTIFSITSVFQTEENKWRLRGTWVAPTHRGLGFGRQMIDQAIERIRGKKNNFLLWTMARKTSYQFYINNQFKLDKEIEGYEFGPHVIMKRQI